MGALDGLRVVDVSRVLAGPFCGQLFADNGAEVIKVEPPEGDQNRDFPLAFGAGESTNFRSVNRGKRGIALNLKTPPARAVLDQLIERADVLIQSFLPKVATSLGVDWDRVHQLNPNLIYVSISGYGANGALADKPGYDTLVAAYSGIMALTGEPDRPPVRPGVSAIDMATGMLAYSGATTALMARERGVAGGQRVNVSLLETAVTLLGFHAVTWLQAGKRNGREGAGFSTLAPYDAYRAKDGDLMIGAPTETMWAKTCLALDAVELLDDPRFKSNADRCANDDALRQEIETRLANGSVREWSERLERAGVATSPINTIDTVLADPQVLANDMVVESETADGQRQLLLGLPFKLTATPGTPGRAAPTVGQDTREILQDVLGYDGAQIDALTKPEG